MSITSSSAKVIAACLIISVSMQMCCSSAIPIWEFLTRNEKMSYLYSTFGQLVSVHCKATAKATSTIPVNQCKRNLLNYGYEKLQTFSNEQLDAVDPYQRGASELIWSSIMRDHPSSTLITTRKPISIPPATSIIILTHQNPVKPLSPTSTTTIDAGDDPSSSISTSTLNSDNDSQQYPQNPLFESESGEKGHKFAMDMDIAYGDPSKHDYNPSQVEVFDISNEQYHRNTEERQQATFLTGPLVFRVRPDGTPVDDTHPIDDDFEGYQLNAGPVLIMSSSPASSTSPKSSSVTEEPTQIVHAAAGRPTKHRKIATISALKQQYLSNLALQQQLQPPVKEPAQELQPPLERPRPRRQYPAMTSFAGRYTAA